MENGVFKNALLGGFDKVDVTEYIEKSARQAAEAQERLHQENDALRADLAGREERLSALEEQAERLTRELCQAREEQERLTEAHRRLESAELERLAAEAEALRPDAEAYRQFRNRIGDIECEARKRAADLEQTAMARMEKLSAEFGARYAALRSTFDATAAHVTAELRKVEVNLTQLPRAMDQAGAELKGLDELLAHSRREPED